MKNLKLKLLTLGIVGTIVISPTSAFAVTNTNDSTSNTKDNVSTINYDVTVKHSFNYGPNGGPEADVIIRNGGIIQLGDVGRAVKEVQQVLVYEGFLSSQSQVDGYFGSITKSAVLNFQKYQNIHNGRGLAEDGIVGFYTWYTMMP